MVRLILIKNLNIDGRSATGIEIGMPDAPPLIIICGERGALLSSYMSLTEVDRHSMAAAIVKGAYSLEEMMERPVTSISSRAESLGVKVGMAAREALRLFI